MVFPEDQYSYHSYLLYENNLKNALSLLDLIIFADDANFLYTNRNTHWLTIRYLNESLNVKKAKYYFLTQNLAERTIFFFGY